jgi:hypothetical protein
MKQPTDAPEERVFLASYSFIYLFSLCFALCVMVIAYPFMGQPATLAGLLQYLMRMAIPMLASYAMTTLFLMWFCRVRVTAEGIRGGTFWGTPVAMSWAEMESVEPRSMFGLPYLRVKSFRESCPTLWIPRFLAKPEQFKGEVTMQTSPLHPLRRSLENGNTPEKRERLTA